MEMVKAGSLKQGDVIRVERWSGLLKRMAPTTATVMDVTDFGENLNITAKAKDGLKEYVTEIFARKDDEYEKIA